ncbi:hypothetical protein VTK56DRAFT_7388 [Thermocarpiscus australiensis]
MADHLTSVMLFGFHSAKDPTLRYVSTSPRRERAPRRPKTPANARTRAGDSHRLSHGVSQPHPAFHPEWPPTRPAAAPADPTTRELSAPVKHSPSLGPALPADTGGGTVRILLFHPLRLGTGAHWMTYKMALQFCSQCSRQPEGGVRLSDSGRQSDKRAGPLESWRIRLTLPAGWSQKTGIGLS